jgi:hypothetical protein
MYVQLMKKTLQVRKFIERCMYGSVSVTIFLWKLCRNERRRWCIDSSILQNFHLQCSHPITSNFTSDMPYCYCYCYYYSHYYYMIHLCAHNFISENHINWFAMVKFWHWDQGSSLWPNLCILLSLRQKSHFMADFLLIVLVVYAICNCIRLIIK